MGFVEALNEVLSTANFILLTAVYQMPVYAGDTRGAGAARGTKRNLRCHGKSVVQPWTGWCFGVLFFHSVGNVIIPADELIFFRGVETTNQWSF
jgi:hypothetical protein